MFYPVISVDLILQVLIETLNKEFQIHFSEETKKCNPSTNTTLTFLRFFWFQKWDLKHDYGNSDTIRIVNNTYIQG